MISDASIKWWNVLNHKSLSDIFYLALLPVGEGLLGEAVKAASG